MRAFTGHDRCCRAVNLDDTDPLAQCRKSARFVGCAASRAGGSLIWKNDKDVFITEMSFFDPWQPNIGG